MSTSALVPRGAPTRLALTVEQENRRADILLSGIFLHFAGNATAARVASYVSMTADYSEDALRAGVWQLMQTWNRGKAPLPADVRAAANAASVRIREAQRVQHQRETPYRPATEDEKEVCRHIRALAAAGYSWCEDQGRFRPHVEVRSLESCHERPGPYAIPSVQSARAAAAAVAAGTWPRVPLKRGPLAQEIDGAMSAPEPADQSPPPVDFGDDIPF